MFLLGSRVVQKFTSLLDTFTSYVGKASQFLRVKSTEDGVEASGVTLDTDGTLAANSDTKIPSQKATKTYADTKVPSSYLDTDGTLAANSDTKVATQKATKTYMDTGLGTKQNTLTNPMVYGDTRHKVGSLTRVMNAASGNVSYTGVGFKPTAITFYGTYAGNGWSVGISDVTTNGSIAVFGTTILDALPNCIYLTQVAGAFYQKAVIASFNSDGFTLTWTYAGTGTTDTATVYYKADR